MKVQLNIFSIITLLFTTIFNSYAQGNVDITADPQTKLLNIGEKTTINIKAEAGNQEVTSIELFISFNPAEVKISSPSITVGSQLPIVFVNTFDNNTGNIEFSGSPSILTSINGSIDVISFEIEALTPTIESLFVYDTAVNKTAVYFAPPGSTETSNVLGATPPINIIVNTPPTISITAPSDGSTIARATDVSFTATATDTEDDNTTLTIEWSSNGGTFDSASAAVNGYFLDSGSSQVTATVTDSNGATSSETITVNVADPALSITGPTEGSLLNSQEVVFDLNPTGMDLVEDHFHIYINPADVNNLTPEERINTSGTPNTTSFTYGATDNIQEGLNTVVIFIASDIHFEFPTTKQIITFTLDSTLPEITLLGDNPMELILNSTYIEPGAIANDSRDGDLSSALIIDASAVDNTIIGDYEVSYTVTDQAGNMTTALRTVQVAPTLSTATPTALQNTIIIAPNPVHNTLHLKIIAPHALTELAIYTIDGRLIERLDTISTLSNNITLNVSDYEAGTYLLIASTDGERKIDQFAIQ